LFDRKAKQAAGLKGISRVSWPNSSVRHNVELWGIDYTSAPRKAKPITALQGRLVDQKGALPQLVVHNFLAWPTTDRWADWLSHSGPWLAVMDLPMGLPTELVLHFAWGTSWEHMVDAVTSLPKDQWVACLREFCAARPVGQKFAHRQCDRPAGSSPSMKWVNPPVALMFYSAAQHLLRSGVSLPGLQAGDASRVVLEGYPGYLARQVLGKQSYKSDAKAKQTADRALARHTLYEALVAGRTRLGIALQVPPDIKARCLEDASGDSLDALICLAQAGYCELHRTIGAHGFGLPDQVAPLEGWIATVQPHA
jgi:Protein of unknown function (DUF429)